jgi:glycosyltransferase involved in cell wall biosynthesis
MRTQERHDFPMVTIVITVYNRLAFLDQAVRSALDQTYPQIELMVVDDGSETDVKRVLEPFGDLVKFYTKPNGGPASARNIGIKHANGEFILFLDDDDFLEPCAVRELVEVVRGEPGARWAAGRFAYADETGKRVPRQHSAQLSSGDVYEGMIHQNLVGAPSVVLAPTEIIRSLGGFDEDRAVQLCEDYDLWLSLAKEFPVAASRRVVSNYRLYPGQATKNWEGLYKAWLNILGKHRKIARPGFAEEFDRSIAAIQLEYGDSLYLNGRYDEARQSWGEAYGKCGITHIGYFIRWAKSHFPNLLRLLRRVRHYRDGLVTGLNNENQHRVSWLRVQNRDS